MILRNSNIMLKFIMFLVFCITSSVSLYSPSPTNTTELTDDNYSSVTNGSSELWILYIYSSSCKTCEEFSSDFKAVVKAVQGVAKMGLINIQEQPQLKKQLEVQEDPVFKLVDATFRKPKTYKGALVKEDIIDYVSKILLVKMKMQAGIYKVRRPQQLDGQVIELNDSNFNKNVLKSGTPWIIQFYAPWCSHCQKFGPTYVKIAKELENEIKCGSVDATNNKLLTYRYEINSFPIVAYFPPGAKETDKPEKYAGHYVSKQAVVEWAQNLTNHLPVEIIELRDENTLKAVCENAPLCIISFLPHILDCQARCRYEYLNVTAKAAINLNSRKWGWIWTEAGAQNGLEETFGIGGSGYPTMVAVSIKKMKYSFLKGPYSVDGVAEFLRGIQSGLSEALLVQKGEMPKVNTIEPWDGKDGILENTNSENDDDEYNNEDKENDDSLPNNSNESTKDEL